MHDRNVSELGGTPPLSVSGWAETGFGHSLQELTASQPGPELIVAYHAGVTEMIDDCRPRRDRCAVGPVTRSPTRHDTLTVQQRLVGVPWASNTGARWQS
jgi:hypothetical protein